MLEKLYQDVWTQVFAATWVSSPLDGDELFAVAKGQAENAALSALVAWDPAKAHAAVCAAQGLTPIEAAVAAQEGE